MTPEAVAAYVYLASTSYDTTSPGEGFVHPEGGGRYGAGRLDTAKRIDNLATFALASPVIPPPPGGAVTPDSTWKRLEVIPPGRWLALPNGRPRLFMEAPAGLAAVSLRLHGGAKCRPPISRMGNKAGYAEAILRVLGLTDGQGAGAYVWAEADVDVAALLRCYPDPAMLRRVAEIIRGWANEDPRALWERLRLDRVLRGRLDDAAGAAGWIVSSTWSYEQGNVRTGFTGPGDRRQDTTATATATATLALEAYQGWAPVSVLSCIPDPSEAASQLGTPGDLSNCVVYMDPPYVGTTGYAHDLPRSQVVALARRYALLGATVAISEATPISMGPGWRTVRLTGERVGQKRTFSKQKEEWLTVYPGRAS
jgi:hypothetical protein